MSYQFYKMLHVISIVVFFAMYARAAVKAQSKQVFKFEGMMMGILGLVILVGGMGLKKFAAAGEWPLWLNLKMLIWLIVTVSGPVILKRFPHFAMKFFWGRLLPKDLPFDFAPLIVLIVLQLIPSLW